MRSAREGNWGFFFQAEDGIRDVAVIGVQTCALPICLVLALDELISERLPVRIGASYRFGVSVKGPGTFKIDLPDSGLYKDAKLSDDRVDIRLDFPWIARGGIEVRPLEALRMELAFSHEHWSVQDAVHVNSDLRIDDVPVLQSYVVGDLEVPRKLRDTWAL